MCSRPAVSTSTASASVSRPVRTASKATDAGSPPAGPRTTRAPTRSPHDWSWSAAAARNVSAAPSTTCPPSAMRTRASLPVVVVLPVPLTPTTRITAGRPSRRDARLRSSAGSTSASSSSPSMARTRLGSPVPSTRARVRSRPTSSSVGATPRSACRSRVSTSSQSCSVRWSRESSASRPRPTAPCERARRARRRTRRPAVGAGTSSPGAVGPAGAGTLGAGGARVPAGSRPGVVSAGGAGGFVPRRRTSATPTIASRMIATLTTM